MTCDSAINSRIEQQPLVLLEPLEDIDCKATRTGDHRSGSAVSINGTGALHRPRRGAARWSAIGPCRNCGFVLHILQRNDSPSSPVSGIRPRALHLLCAATGTPRCGMQLANVVPS
jgi:hypothetical protein